MRLAWPSGIPTNTGSGSARPPPDGGAEESQGTGSETGPSPQPEGRAPRCPQVGLDPTWPWTTALPAQPQLHLAVGPALVLASLLSERQLGTGLPSLWAAQEACHGKGLIGALQVSAPESRAVLERKRENSLLTLHPKSCPGIKEKQA